MISSVKQIHIASIAVFETIKNSTIAQSYLCVQQACWNKSLYYLYVIVVSHLLRYDHVKPLGSSASGGTVGSRPLYISAPPFQRLNSPSEQNPTVTKSKVHESGKREKKTLVLRDRGEQEWVSFFFMDLL